MGGWNLQRVAGASFAFAALLIAGASTLSAFAALPAGASKDPSPAVAADWMDGRWQAPLVYFVGFRNVNGLFQYYNPNVPVPNPPPFTPKYAEIYNNIRNNAFKGIVLFDPGADCAPTGYPIVLLGNAHEYIFSPGRTTVLYDNATRRVYTDGRSPPPADDRDPAYYGHSTGHWEKDTLVIHTVGMRDDTGMDIWMPHSNKLEVWERLRKISKDEIENKITIIDPEALTKPWEVSRVYKRTKDFELQENVCVKSRNPRVNGTTVVLGPDGQPLKPLNEK